MTSCPPRPIVACASSFVANPTQQLSPPADVLLALRFQKRRLGRQERHHVEELERRLRERKQEIEDMRQIDAKLEEASRVSPGSSRSA